MEEDRQGAKAPKEVGVAEPSDALDDIAHVVVDAAFDVHRALGPGFGELVYENALAIELGIRGKTVARQRRVAVEYKGRCVGEGRIDLIVEELLIVELKAVASLLSVHTAQLLAYLKASGRRLGLLINFDVPVLRHGIKRVILTSKSSGALAPWRSNSS